MNTRNIIAAFLLLLTASLSSCLGNDNNETTYEEWRKENTEYITRLQDLTENGVKVYEPVTPPWDPATTILMRWYNDRSQNAGAMVPLSNSTLAVKYLLTNIAGDTLDSSYKNTDSTFFCRPCDLITGFWVATTNMHVGDSVAAVIPYTAGYGITGSGAILPFSTLTFQIKLDSIVAYQTLPWRD